MQVPPVFDPTTSEIKLADDNVVSLTKWDSQGADEFDRLRYASYSKLNIHVAIICFSIASDKSFDNTKIKWWPEVSTYLSGVPLILCGTQCDLRDDPKTVARLAAKGHRIISQAEGEELAKRLGAVSYIECSASKLHNVRDVFSEAARAGINKSKLIHGSGCCSVM